ncbi:MAG TPA: Hpt domain-containing protein [Acidimicrobiales bacterium]|nr:Hpt domain-containing protein [Acidimicrobiales bacterium]
MTAGADDVLDEQVLSWIRNLGQEPGKLLEEMVGLFVADAPRLMAEIDAALAGGSTAGLARAAHRLKGAAAHIGAVRLCRTATEVEARATAGTPQEASCTSAAVHGEMDATLQALEGLVA